MVDIEFNNENIEKCHCPCCSVQAVSKCAYEKLDKLQSIKGTPEPKEIPGMYCVSGKVTCTDFNSEGQCQCPQCEVWKKYNLDQGKPTGYFCQNGKTK